MKAVEIAGLKRETLINALGGKCSCSGDGCWHTGECIIADRRCLQVDHINGDGAKDRKRLRSVGVVNYYFSHLAEARGKVQLLCANCNWVKRHQNYEYRNGKIIQDRVDDFPVRIGQKVSRLARVTSELTGLPDYEKLCTDAENFTRRMVEETAYVDLVDWVESIGLNVYARRSIAYQLAKRWEKQKSFGDSQEALADFLYFVRASFDSICRIAEMRIKDDKQKDENAENGKVIANG